MGITTYDWTICSTAINKRLQNFEKKRYKYCNGHINFNICDSMDGELYMTTERNNVYFNVNFQNVVTKKVNIVNIFNFLNKVIDVYKTSSYTEFPAISLIMDNKIDDKRSIEIMRYYYACQINYLYAHTNQTVRVTYTDYDKSSAADKKQAYNLFKGVYAQCQEYGF